MELPLSIYQIREYQVIKDLDERHLLATGSHRVPLVIGCLDAMPPPAGCHESSPAGWKVWTTFASAEGAV